MFMCFLPKSDFKRAVAIRKMCNSQTLAQANNPERVAEETSLTKQLLGRMLSFFGMKSRERLRANETASLASDFGKQSAPAHSQQGFSDAPVPK